MAKQKKQMLVMVVLLAVCILAYLGIRLYTKNVEKREAEAETEAEAELVVASFDPEAVTAFSYDVDGTRYAFTKNGGGWSCDGSPELELDTDSVEAMLESAETVQAAEKLTEYESLADFGLDAPGHTITITCGDSAATLLIGSYNEMLGEYYLMVEGEDTVYLADSTLVSAFSKTPEELVAEEDTETEEVTEE